MGDDEAEHESEPRGVRPPISKRKAPTDGASPVTRRPQKAPRLDLGGGASGSGSINAGFASASGSRLPPSSSSPLSGAARHRHVAPSLTQPAPQKLPFSPTRRGPPPAESPDGSGGTSTSEFPRTISQSVRKMVAREKEKEKEKRERAERGRREDATTARKHTVQPMNVRKVTMGNLLKKAQETSASLFTFFSF